ncbi:LOW QUALITY PROTEIN: ceramide-1-phosphate transfer protein [Aplochiton taeniatus]
MERSEPGPPLAPEVQNRGGAEREKWALESLPQECPGQTFQVWRLLFHLGHALGPAHNDVLLEPYLDSWDELIRFMESLGPIIGFFSGKVKEKLALIRELSLKHREHLGRLSPSDPAGLDSPSAYSSVLSMVKAELDRGLVNFSRRSQSGCRTLLRLHRSLQWLKLLLQGLTEGPDAQGQYRTPGELCREAYSMALAPHHPWLMRQAAELVFVALPGRQVFLDTVCVTNQAEATPVLHTLIEAIGLVHTRTQRILNTHRMLDLP